MNTIVKISPNKEYMVIDLVKEYAGSTAFVGTEHYAIVTDLSEEDLTSSFSQELDPYKPYVIISREMYRAMQETHRNDNREHWRDRFCHDTFAIEMEKLPINWKAASIYGLGLHAIRRISNAENCPFVLWNGNKRLIKRRLFEEFLFSQNRI